MALIKERTRWLNRYRTQALALSNSQSKARPGQIKRQLTALELARLALSRQCPKRARTFDILCSIPGPGRVTVVAILIDFPEIGTMDSKQLAPLAGLAPMTRQSGRRRRRTDRWRILGDLGIAFMRGGRKVPRDALYRPALDAARSSRDLLQKYQSMIQAGKPVKVALTALLRKLIETARAPVRQEREWTPGSA